MRQSLYCYYIRDKQATCFTNADNRNYIISIKYINANINNYVLLTFLIVIDK